MTALIGLKNLVSAGMDWEPGDRIGVRRTASPERLGAPAELLLGEREVLQLDDSGGNSLAFHAQPDLGILTVAGMSRLFPVTLPLCLELVEENHYRLVAAELLPRLGESPPVEAGTLTIADDPPGDLEVLFHAQALGAGPAELRLAERAARLATQPSFDQLISLPLVREMELLEHQIRTARTVLSRFRGRALLCDEVGLGKTIEAGLILSELALRGLARSVLVLVPPSLIEQWRGELARKFSLSFVAQDDAEFRQRKAAAWTQFERVIVSTHTAKREPHRSAILARRWDLVIIDEAHHLRNRNTVLWKFASQLDKQYQLLLTATPVQNRLDDLFNLVTLLEPGLLSTAKQFDRQFVDRRDKQAPRNLDQLHALLAEVMVRNRRSTVGLQFTRRWARTESVPLTADEADLYRRATRLVREQLRQPERAGGELSRMALLTLQMALGSSSRAAAGTLANLAASAAADSPLAAQLAALADSARAVLENSKLARLERLLAEFPDKLVVFTHFRATQAMLAERLSAAGHRLAVFHGGLSRLEKEAAVEEFRGPARVLLCTEAGSEGRNLQFAHGICNYDLPWNPMRIEQRIGRLSRIGQQRDVYVFNLVAAGTVEAAVLHLLDAKLSMFELVIGEIDMILGNLDEEQEFQDMVADLWVASSDDEDFVRRMEQLGERLLSAKQEYFAQRQRDDRLFGSRFAPDA